MEDRIWSCLIKRLNGNETPESSAMLDFWLAENEDNRKAYDEAKSIWTLSTTVEPEPPAIPFPIFSEQLKATPQLVRRNSNLFWKYGIAATITAILSIGGIYFFKDSRVTDLKVEWIVKRANVGEVIKVSLPDSSTVWLNAGTEISYASKFTEQPLRIVKLSGEAYFEVKHDQKHPFVVKSSVLTTTVYGTSFSVSAYDNEAKSAIAVNSGKVGVATTENVNHNSAIMLLPNDQLTYNSKNKSFSKSTIARADVNAWTKGELIFDQTPLNEVLQTIARTYKVKFDASQLSKNNCKLTARFKNQPIQVILKVLMLSLHIQSTQVKQTIYLKGGNCM